MIESRPLSGERSRWVVGYLIEVIADKSLAEFFEKKIF